MSQLAINPQTATSHHATASIRIFPDLDPPVNFRLYDPIVLSDVKPCRWTALSLQNLRRWPSRTPRTLAARLFLLPLAPPVLRPSLAIT